MAQLTKEQFCDYVKDHVLGFLPPSFEGAEVMVKVVTKANDVKLTGMTIRREGEIIAPNIYLESFYDRYKNGSDLDKLVGDVADTRIEYNRDDFPIGVENLQKYDAIKPYLQIRLCDPETNKDRLDGLISTPVGDYTATYIVKLQDSDERFGTISVTPQLLNMWGVTAEQLHADALAADEARTPVLSPVMEVLMQMTQGGEPKNLLKGDVPEPDGLFGMNLYCLSVDDKTYGASLYANPNVMEQVGNALGENYFVLPSSIHELMIVPESSGIPASELEAMVMEINENEVLPEEVLSNKVHFYDRETGVLVNAVKREQEMEQALRRPSLAEQLAQKKDEVRNRPSKTEHTKPRDAVSLG